jgi:shikimate 5-dehydrogenase
VGDGLGASEPRGEGGAAGSSSREAEELKASIISVTQREKDRVEGLQAQLEMIRIELKVKRYIYIVFCACSH